MKQIAIIYHSAHGHTEVFARQVLAGAQSREGIAASLLKAEALTTNPERLRVFDGIILGSPTYLGGVSGTFKSFMDATGGLWRKQAGHGAAADPFAPGDMKTARMFGEHFAHAMGRMAP